MPVTIKSHVAEWAKRLRELDKGKRVKIGLLAGKNENRSNDGVTNVDLGLIHEFGTSDGHIPARPFLRPTMAREQAKYERLLAEVTKRSLEGLYPLDKGLGLLGQAAVADVRATITQGAGVQPANAPSTIQRKGSSRPLVDTGRMVNAISYAIVEGEDK